MRVILAMALKDLRVLFRLRIAVFFSFVWPALVAVFFGLIFSGQGGRSAKVRIAVVDEDGSAGSAAFASRLEGRKELDAIGADRDQALSLVRQGARTAAVVIPPGFGEAAGRMFYGTPPRVEVWIDPSRQAESAMLQGILFQQGAERMQQLFSDRAASQAMVDKALEELRAAPEGVAGKDETNRFLGELDRFLQTAPAPGNGGTTANWQPLEVEEKPVTAGRRGPVPKNSFELTFPQGILWGIIGCVMTFGLGIVTERTHGTMVRLQVSPISRAELLGGKAAACFIAIAIVEVSLFALGRIFFGVRPASWPLLALAGTASAVGFVGIMMLVSVLGKTEQAAAGAGWAVMMPIAMFGGGMVPLFVMPAWMAAASNLSPAKWAVLALEGAIWRGFSLAEMVLPCALLLLVGVVSFAVGTWGQVWE